MSAPLLPALPGYDDPQLIAHGTTALVFRATQTRLNRPVAIKVITADTGSIPVNAERELATTVALSSQPHIVSIIDTGVTDDDRPYIVMEYCEGGSFAQILRHDGPLPVDDVLEVGVKIGEALHAAHQAGIVHRDVKPSNILRSRFGPALTDFGIARAPDELGGTLTREMMTPHHASPEALLHQAQSGISDIYSLASTMWTLLIGHPPFVDPTRPPVDMYAFRDRVLHDALPPMTRDDVPAWLVGELGRAMSKLPSGRHGSALEFADALRRGALGLSPMAAPATKPAPGPGSAEMGSAEMGSAEMGQRPAATGGRAAGGQVHVPGVPAQAWPVPEPAGVPPASSGPGVVPAQRTPATAPATTAPVAPAAAAAAAARPGIGAGTDSAARPDGDPAGPRGWSVPAAPEYRPPPRPPTPGPSFATPAGSPFSPLAASPFAPPAAAAPVATPPAPPVGGHSESGLDLRSGAQPRVESRPEARSDLDDGRDTADQGGWLGTATDWRSTPDPGPQPTSPPDPAGQTHLVARRFDETDLLPPQTRHRGTLLAVLIAAAVLAVGGAAVLVLTSPRGSSTGDTTPVASASPTRFISAQAEGKPRDVRITEDRGTSVTVGWTDPTAGTVTFVVVGTGTGGEKLETKTIQRGTTTVAYNQLSTKKNYCFVIGAVYAVDSVALATEVCTKR